MDLSIILGKGRDAELDAAKERVYDAARVLEQRKVVAPFYLDFSICIRRSKFHWDL